MFKKNMKGAVFALIAAATLTGTAAPVFAADPTSFNNSTASTVSGTHNETFTAGSDASQNQVGKETDQVLGGATASNPTETKSQNVFCICNKVKQRTAQGTTGAYWKCNKECLSCRCKG